MIDLHFISLSNNEFNFNKVNISNDKVDIYEKIVFLNSNK